MLEERAEVVQEIVDFFRGKTVEAASLLKGFLPAEAAVGAVKPIRREEGCCSGEEQGDITHARRAWYLPVASHMVSW